jgi:transposase-like protein
MWKQTRHKFLPEVRERAMRTVFDHQTEHTSQWATITSIASKIGCNPETLRSWVRQAESDGWTGSITAGSWSRSANIPPAEAEERHYAILDKRAMAA